jgi:hypothetical protein
VTDTARNVLAAVALYGPLVISSGLNRFYIGQLHPALTSLRSWRRWCLQSV